jgi:hypothetical protein
LQQNPKIEKAWVKCNCTQKCLSLKKKVKIKPLLDTEKSLKVIKVQIVLDLVVFKIFIKAGDFYCSGCFNSTFSMFCKNEN